MRLKAFLIGSSILLIAALALTSQGFLAASLNVLSNLDAKWWGIVALSVIIQLLGHLLRTLRTKTVLDQVKKGRTIDQFNALAVGYLFNSLLPLRIGEAIRSLLIALELRISFLYTFTVVVLERVLDLFLVGLLVLAIALFFNAAVGQTLVLAALGVTIFSLVFIVSLVFLVRENKVIMNLIYRFTALFNEGLCNKLRFKVWSLIFGLQQFIGQKPLLRRYALLTVGSWFCYIVSMAVIAVPLFHSSPADTFVNATVPYVAVGAPTGPASASNYEDGLVSVITDEPGDSLQYYAVLSWLILTIPMSILGLVGLVMFNGKLRRRSKFASEQAFDNKLLRHEDISQEFPAFLDFYFSGNSLAKILHKLEIAGELSLVKFFKGGSDAITILVLSRKKMFVKKIIPIRVEDRLKAQYDWLKKNRRIPYLVKTLGEQRTDDYYAIDLAYDPEDIPFFEYIHHNSIREAIEVLDETWQHLYDHVHKNRKPAALHAGLRDKYIKTHIFGCVEKATAANKEIKKAIQPEKLTINGEEYDNFHQVMEKIRNCKPAWEDIATFQQSSGVHGDMSIDNILVHATTRKPLIIDPAPDGNIINGPVFEFGKMSQSFYCGYEFLFRDEDDVHLNRDGSINYRDHRSAKYTRLWNHLHKELAPKYLTESEVRSLPFHAAALHFRRLKHQVHYCPANVLKFYAAAVKAMNEFLAQYEQKTP
jgi:uncharacterized protein (TIRG00374 family)